MINTPGGRSKQPLETIHPQGRTPDQGQNVLGQSKPTTRVGIPPMCPCSPGMTTQQHGRCGRTRNSAPIHTRPWWSRRGRRSLIRPASTNSRWRPRRGRANRGAEHTSSQSGLRWWELTQTMRAGVCSRFQKLWGRVLSNRKLSPAVSRCSSPSTTMAMLPSRTRPPSSPSCE